MASMGKQGIGAAVAGGRPVVIGLCGGIASGKSSVREALSLLGAATIDADKLGHSLYTPGSETAAAVGAAFGVATEDGGVDRAALGPIVFGDPAEMKRLTDIVWPKLREKTHAAVEQAAASASAAAGEKGEGGAYPVTVVEAAILLEAGWEDEFDEVWVVSVPREVACARLMERNSLDQDAANSRIDAQMGNDQRLTHADRVIDNSGGRDDLQANVRSVWDALQADVAQSQATS